MVHWKINTLFLLLFSLHAFAIPVKNLYQINIVVLSQSAAEQEQAMRQALDTLLLRLTGKITLPNNNATLDQAKNNVKNFINSYSYTVDQEGQQSIDITFNAGAIENLLRNANLLLWGSDRPIITAWIAVDAGAGRYIQQENITTALTENLKQRFHTRRIPLVFPRMDLQDQTISPVIAWGMFSQDLLMASKRYNSAIVLSGRLYLRNGTYSGLLSLIQPNNREDKKITDLDAATLAQEVSQWIAQRLSSQYAISLTNIGAIPELTITNMHSILAVSRLLNYLNHLSAVRGITLNKVSNDKMHFSLRIDGSTAQLRENLKLGADLQALTTYNPYITTKQPLIYRWIGAS